MKHLTRFLWFFARARARAASGSFVLVSGACRARGREFILFSKVDGGNSRRTRDRDAERLLHTVVQPLRKGKGEERG